MSRSETPRCCWCGDLALGSHGLHDLGFDGSAGERVVFRWHMACADLDPVMQALADVASMPDGPESDAAAAVAYADARATLEARHGAAMLPAVLHVARDFPERRRTLRARGRWGLMTEVRG
jgi:hypothetical protein